MSLNFNVNVPYQERVENFTQFKGKYSDWQKKFSVYETDPKINYGRIVLNFWLNENVKHQYAAAIDLKSGDVYLDCRPRKIYKKIIAATFLRSVVLVVKTITHILFIPIIYQLVKALKNKNDEQRWVEFKRKSIQSLVDIVRGPAYEIAMLVVQIAALIVIPISPLCAYKARKFLSVTEIKANRITNKISQHSFQACKGWSVMPCFTPIFNLGDFVQKDDENDVKLTLWNNAERIIKARTKYRQLMNDCYQLWPANKPYVSPATPKEALIKQNH